LSGHSGFRFLLLTSCIQPKVAFVYVMEIMEIWWSSDKNKLGHFLDYPVYIRPTLNSHSAALSSAQCWDHDNTRTHSSTMDIAV